MFNQNFIQFIRTSCCDALQQDGEYMRLQAAYVIAENDGDEQSKEEINCDMEVRAEEVCFTAGFNAAMQLCLKGAAI